MKKNLFQEDNIDNFKIILQSDIGVRLDHYISNKLPKYSRSKIQNLIRSNNILVNSKQCKTGYRLELNDFITINYPPEKEEGYFKITPEPINLNILFEDEDIAIIDKPSGLVVHPGKGNRSGTLVNGLLHYFGNLSDVNGLIRPGIVHRLDKNTSGLIIIAKNNNAHKNLSEQFRYRSIKKEYCALTWGLWEKKEGQIEVGLKRDKNDPTKYCVSRNGKKSITSFKVNKEFQHCSLINFFPKTGRTHQIRVHSASLGYPILGDDKYGGGISKTKGYMEEYSKKYRRYLSNFDRYALHAKKLEFLHPRNKSVVKFECSLPNEFIELIKKLDNIIES